jgi:elongation factor P
VFERSVEDPMKVNELKRGNVVRYNNDLWQIQEMEHVKPGKGPAYYQVKLKNVTNGTNISQRMNVFDDLDLMYTERREMEYLYQDGVGHVFMDTETYEQVTLSEDLVGEAMQYVPHNSSVSVLFVDGKPTIVDLPAAVELEVTETEAAVKGDTATNVTKRAETQTGLVVKVPIHIKKGEKIKVDTRTGEFLGRAK